MNLSLDQIAELVGGRVTGNGKLEIIGAGTLRDARPGEISFVDNAKLSTDLEATKAAAVVVPLTYQPEGISYVTVRSVRAAFAKIVAHFRPPRLRESIGISPAAHVSASARLAEDVEVDPGAFVGDHVHIQSGCVIHSGVCIMAGCRIAENVTIFPQAVLYEDTVVGPRSIVHAGAVLGSYGFGYETVDGRHQRTSQLGFVWIGADVEIGAGTTIDRGTFGPTMIGDGTKIDNQVMIGHNCRIGKHNLLCSQVGIAGSVTTGEYVVMAGQVGIRDHVTIGDGVVLGARSGVGSDIPDAGTYFGAPARPDREQLQILFAQQKVPAMRQQLKSLQRTVDELVGAEKEKSSQRDAA
jgi:UDP-3-O-[3-hydroxymyristoyl] glucosamine N-acyltransferase